MFNIVLYEPQIAPNTGNIIRLCANTGANLHLIKPLGFQISDKKLKRAGLDYHEFTRIRTYDSLTECLKSFQRVVFFAFSTKGKTNMFEAKFVRDSLLIFGSETDGLPNSFLQTLPAAHSLKIPMVKHSRSLNLSNAVTVGVYEAWRQASFKNSSFGSY